MIFIPIAVCLINVGLVQWDKVHGVDVWGAQSGDEKVDGEDVNVMINPTILIKTAQKTTATATTACRQQ